MILISLLSVNKFLFTTLSTFQRTKTCGANRDRTDNLRLARAALSQLSYSPRISSGRFVLKHAPKVGLSRIELLTSRLSGVRSNHLSYRPVI